MTRLNELYKKEVIPMMMKRFNYSSVMEVPKLLKITLNMGVGEAVGDKKVMNHAVEDMTLIAGQKPVVTLASKSVASFKIRDGYPIGCKVTLRRNQMYEFLDRLVNVSLPRIRDFNGTSRKAFDKGGNYTLGITDQGIFPEIDPGVRDFRIQGMDISFVFEGGNKEQNFEVLRLLGMPFSKQ